MKDCIVNLPAYFMACLKINLPEEQVYGIIGMQLQLKKNLLLMHYRLTLIGMNAKLMCQYIEFVADRWLVELGYSKIL